MPPPPKKIERRALPDIICDELRADIRAGVYAPNEPVRIRALAERFGVSTMPVREALRRLEAEGLMEFENNRITVRGVNPTEADELFAIRRALEPMAARRAVPVLANDDDAIAKLRSLIKKMDQETDRYEWGLLNHEFHKVIYEAARMPRLNAIMESIWAATEPYMRRFSRTTDHIERAQQQHREVLEAIVAGDARRTESLVRRHITYSRDSYTRDLFTAPALAEH